MRSKRLPECCVIYRICLPCISHERRASSGNQWHEIYSVAFFLNHPFLVRFMSEYSKHDRLSFSILYDKTCKSASQSTERLALLSSAATFLRKRLSFHCYSPQRNSKCSLFILSLKSYFSRCWLYPRVLPTISLSIRKHIHSHRRSKRTERKRTE